MWSELAISLQNANTYLIVMLVLAFFALVVSLERLIMLQLVYYIDFSKFLSSFKKIVQAEDLERAINLCKSASKTSLPLITLKALEAAERDPTTVKGTIEEESIDFLPKLEARIGILPSLATLILLVGILGTIDGLWSAFDSIEILDTAEKQARLAHGIAGSLNPTALGLLVCMLILAFYQVLKGLAIKLAERLHYGITVISNLLIPQEVATYVAAPNAQMAPPPIQPDVADAPSGEETIEEEEGDDDAFDDAAVEDIKDEEEII